MLFAVRHQTSEGGGGGDGDQRYSDPLPGVLEAVLVQALAFQPPFWLFLIRNSLPAPIKVNRARARAAGRRGLRTNW